MAKGTPGDGDSGVDSVVSKVHKVHKVTGVLRTVFIGSASCRRQSARGVKDFIDLMDFMD